MKRKRDTQFDMTVVTNCANCCDESSLSYNRKMDKQTREALERLERKIDTKNDRAQDKMDEINKGLSRLLGPLARVSEKTDGLSRLVWWLFGLLSVIISAIAVKVFTG
jgi:hypothetical protein